MHATMVATVAGWHPAIHRLVESIDPATLFSHPFRRLDPIPPWPTSRVTCVGDAIHAMLPTLGKGANMAMRNAAALRDQLVAAARDERPLLEAIAAYEADMRAATFPLMEVAADHGNFGGGGLPASRRRGGLGMRVLGLAAGNPARQRGDPAYGGPAGRSRRWCGGGARPS